MMVRETVVILTAWSALLKVVLARTRNWREMKRTTIEVIPGARRLIIALRDLGYDFVKAATDVIDNSIEVGVTSVKIRMEFNGDHSWFQVADNGRGCRKEDREINRIVQQTDSNI